MTLPALVLVHGGGLAADCWELTVDEINRVAPELTVLVVDLLVGDIESAGVEDIVIVGHSMGGISLPGAVTKLGAARVREMIFAAAFLPPECTSIVESSPWLMAQVSRRNAKKNVPTETPKWMARFVFLNGVPSHNRFITGKLYAESIRILTEKVSRRGMPDDIPRTWILTLRDRAPLAEGTAQIH